MNNTPTPPIGYELLPKGARTIEGDMIYREHEGWSHAYKGCIVENNYWARKKTAMNKDITYQIEWKTRTQLVTIAHYLYAKGYKGWYSDSLTEEAI